MQTSDGPTNPRTRRVLKNRQVSFTPHPVSPMQHLQAVIVRNSKHLGFCFGEQESEPYPRTQMSDRPAHSSHTFLKKVFKIIVTHYFSLGLMKLGPWVRNLTRVPVNIKVHLTIYLAHFT